MCGTAPAPPSRTRGAACPHAPASGPIRRSHPKDGYSKQTVESACAHALLPRPLKADPCRAQPARELRRRAPLSPPPFFRACGARPPPWRGTQADTPARPGFHLRREPALPVTPIHGPGGGGGRGVHGLYGARQAARAGCDATRLGQGQAPVPSRTCNCLLPDVGARSRPPDCPSPSLSPYPGCCRVLGCACACVRACTDVLSPARAPTHGAPMRHGAPSSALFRAAARAAAQRVVPRGGAGGGGGGAGAGRGGRGALLQQELAGLMREERRLPWLLPQRSAGQRALLHGVVRLRRRCAMLDGQQECLLVRQRRRRRVALQVPQSGAQGPPRRLATERRHAVQPGLLRRR